MTPETPDVAETAKFLRRFADLMSNGQNAAYLQNAAVLLETLTDRLSAALEEEELWRYKHETAIQHADALEAECDALKHDIEGHVNITSTILSERDALKSALEAQEQETSGLHADRVRERDELAMKLQTQAKADVDIRIAFDRELESFKSTLEARDDELDRLRGDLAHERENFATVSQAHQNELSGLRLAFDQERAELLGQQKSLGEELAKIRSKYDALKLKIADLDQIGNQQAAGDRSTGRSVTAGPGPHAGSSPSAVDPDPESEETNAVVPKTTLRQVRAQFEYLAKEFIALGDIASQVMCELGINSMDLVLNADRRD